MSTFQTIFAGIFTFSVLVLLHEGGHFLAARAFGVRVREFMLGLPGPKISFKRGETTFGVTAIPLGGYVRISGMEGDGQNPMLPAVLSYITMQHSVSLEDICKHFHVPDNDMVGMVLALHDWDAIDFSDEICTAKYGAEETEDSDTLFAKARSHTYLELPTWKRIVILSAGVTVNIILALLVFTVVLSGWGVYKDIGAISPVKDAPAKSAGLVEGDRIISINGTKVGEFGEISQILNSSKPGDSVTISYAREGIERSIDIALGTHPDTGGAYLGVSPQLVKVRLGLIDAIKESGSYVVLTLKGLAGFFNPANFSESVKGSVSVVGISVIAAEAMRSSALDYAWLIAAISLSLGIMNLLPIPPLDGGKIVIEVIERIRKRPLSPRVTVGFSLAGMAVLICLMAVLMYNDIGRLLG